MGGRLSLQWRGAPGRRMLGTLDVADRKAKIARGSSDGLQREGGGLGTCVEGGQGCTSLPLIITSSCISNSSHITSHIKSSRINGCLNSWMDPGGPTGQQTCNRFNDHINSHTGSRTSFHRRQGGLLGHLPPGKQPRGGGGGPGGSSRSRTGAPPSSAGRLRGGDGGRGSRAQQPRRMVAASWANRARLRGGTCAYCAARRCRWLSSAVGGSGLCARGLNIYPTWPG